jgi:hypothetical protein
MFLFCFSSVGNSEQKEGLIPFDFERDFSGARTIEKTPWTCSSGASKLSHPTSDQSYLQGCMVSLMLERQSQSLLW